MLDGTIEAFLTNRLSYRCFREHAGEIKLLIFPDLMNLKKPQRDDLITENGSPAYFQVPQKIHSQDSWYYSDTPTYLPVPDGAAHDVAWFESPDKEICGVRQIRDDNEMRDCVALQSRRQRVTFARSLKGLLNKC